VTCNMLQDVVYRVDRRTPDCMRSGAGVCYLLLISQSCLIDTPRRPTYMISVSKAANRTFFFVSSQKMSSAPQHTHTRTHALVLLHIQSYIHSFISFVHSIGQPDTHFFSVRRTRRLTTFQQLRLRLNKPVQASFSCSS
jgi:hypothetical protein